MDDWWKGLPIDRTINLIGTDLDYLERSLDPLPPGAPVMVFLSDLEGSKQTIIAEVIQRIDSAVVKLYPAWLPGADSVESRGPGARALVRGLAKREAGESHEFANFLTEIADRALTGGTSKVAVLDELRLNGLVRLVQRAYRRDSVAIVINLPADLTPVEEGEFVGAAEWVATYAPAGVWLVGVLRSIDRLRRVSVVPLAEEANEEAPEVAEEPADVSFPAIGGIPHPGSPAEQALERALQSQPWASGRSWNQVIDFGPLLKAIRVDLVWPDERCVVEIDGDEHRLRAHYAADRRRDVRLQVIGFAVLRFTNEQIYHDLAATLRALGQFLTRRREQGGV